MDFSTGDQPDASVSPESSCSGMQAQQQQQQQRVSIHKPFTQSRVPPDLPMHPAPRHITEEELRVLEGCLHRWRSEVENDTRGTNIHPCMQTCARIAYNLISVSCCFGLCKFTCFCLICVRFAGQYIQNPQNHRAYVFWQVHDAGKKLFEISDSFLYTSKMTPEWVHLYLMLCFRCRTGCMLFWSMRVRLTQVTTGRTSTTHITDNGWSTTTFQWQSRPGRSWCETRSVDTAMPAHTASCTLMIKNPSLLKVTSSAYANFWFS